MERQTTTLEIARNERQRTAFWRAVLGASLAELSHYQRQIRRAFRRCSCDRAAHRSGLCHRCAALSTPPRRRLALMARVRRRLVVALEKQTPKGYRKAVVQ